MRLALGAVSVSLSGCGDVNPVQIHGTRAIRPAIPAKRALAAVLATTRRAAQVAAVVLENQPLAARAEDVELHPDGSFQALVPVRPGRNLITLALTSREGVRETQIVEVSVEPGASAEPSDPALADARRRLLERWSARTARPRSSD